MHAVIRAAIAQYFEKASCVSSQVGRVRTHLNLRAERLDLVPVVERSISVDEEVKMVLIPVDFSKDLNELGLCASSVERAYNM